MDFEKYFLAEDIADAKQEYVALTEMLHRVDNGLWRGDLKWMEENLCGALKRVRNMIDLSKEKQGKEQLIRLADELSELGIDPLKVLGDKNANRQN
ncbi:MULTISPECIES: hypothetical protein [Virgibacillus]|uniref:Uncharacterized protein n=1 Tax=Virgibacillus pantothenticus TaxID=1473 RepID=A0A0L0QLF0_VIRPA|nr:MULTISPECIES: hypothetical protein [Virgibacillus]KNE19073.1 hypothetical protein AFK71_10975 [Virgibacillus pantothenticus]MED3737239.1 hypothetical protein [Virgibacillus pantothenticus]QTY15523.1 hypothetical protein KBP50_16775 [Virgibacillus pantothenticus]QTY16909.1 hypothetical protein KBP50_03020 [Virgibacillus pantothenticus]SIS85520.1 hypothetical protein SAMN05421787_1055 [Virgibacillus pantothenticus]